MCCLIPPSWTTGSLVLRSDFLSDYNIHLLTSHQPKPLLHEAWGWAPDVHFLTGLRSPPTLGKSISNMEESVTLDNGVGRLSPTAATSPQEHLLKEEWGQVARQHRQPSTYGSFESQEGGC